MQPLTGKTNSQIAFNIYLNNSAGNTPKELCFYDSQNKGRQSIEGYITRQFQLTHGATINHFMPLLLALNEQGKTSAALGLQTAVGQSLFLQQYLPCAIDESIALHAKVPVALNRIIEIGNLVATRPGASQLLFMLLTKILYLAQYEWVVFTATPMVQKSLERLGFNLTVLADANAEHLIPAEKLNWGSYYEQQPRVLAGNINQGIQALNKGTWPAQLTSYTTTVARLAAAIGHVPSA